eukprot:COSAG02_NODE_296_length_25401_cov_7.672437_3_plen_86_part_00
MEKTGKVGKLGDFRTMKLSGSRLEWPVRPSLARRHMGRLSPPPSLQVIQYNDGSVKMATSRDARMSGMGSGHEVGALNLTVDQVG